MHQSMQKLLDVDAALLYTDTGKRLANFLQA